MLLVYHNAPCLSASINHLHFYSFADLQEQMKRYLRRANNIPMAVLGWKSPNQKQTELENARV